ncbi:hypothetical protein GCM10010260_05650 [Streptomyces filipinensis]|uniref:Uncharacterized protein n=1 Tax=Streptomyces filipinensis TaxID=66887 RepID=A0A918M809_9ACTN|nr:hypothetical protein GCM10010260_05650 [Streptomyces filipinensis]
MADPDGCDLKDPRETARKAAKAVCEWGPLVIQALRVLWDLLGS